MAFGFASGPVVLSKAGAGDLLANPMDLGEFNKKTKKAYIFHIVHSLFLGPKSVLAQIEFQRYILAIR